MMKEGYNKNRTFRYSQQKDNSIPSLSQTLVELASSHTHSPRSLPATSPFAYSKTDSKDDSQPVEMSYFSRQVTSVLSSGEMPVDLDRRKESSRGFESHLLRYIFSGAGRESCSLPSCSSSRSSSRSSTRMTSSSMAS